MSKFFVNKKDINENFINITGEDVKHIQKVLRMQPGEPLTICDGNGSDYDVVIERFESDHIVTSIKAITAALTEPPIEVVLYQGIPKGDKMEFIIQKCVELGITKIVPVITDRTVVKFENQKEALKKADRWRKIAAEAAKQCNRGILPDVSEPLQFKKAIETVKTFDARFIPYECEKENSLKKHLMTFSGKKIAIFIGPEGGFTEEEIEFSKSNNIIPVTLGPRILRTETAGIAVLAIIMYEKGDI